MIGDRAAIAERSTIAALNSQTLRVPTLAANYASVVAFAKQL